MGVNKCFHGLCSELSCGVEDLTTAADHWIDVGARAGQEQCHDDWLVAVLTKLRLNLKGV